MRTRATGPLALLLAAACAGCATMAVPPALSDSERSVVADAHVPVTVGVERYEAPVYSGHLLDGLRATELFDHVAPLEEFAEPPSLVARVDRRIYGKASIAPLLTILTLGIIPTSMDEESGYSFTLSAPGRPTERVSLEYAHVGRSTLGWIAIPDFLFSSDRTMLVHPRSSSRMIDRLRLAIVKRRDELERLGHASPP